MVLESAILEITMNNKTKPYKVTLTIEVVISAKDYEEAEKKSYRTLEQAHYGIDVQDDSETVLRRAKYGSALIEPMTWAELADYGG